MSIEDLTLRQLTERVEATNNARQAREKRENRARVRALTDQIMDITHPVHTAPHEFRPYPNPDMNPGCLRCCYPLDHRVHHASDS